MIGQKITGEDGKPLEGLKLEQELSYNPPQEVLKLMQRVQQDYQVGWALQHRPFDEFDGVSLLERARLDQETFAAYVGAIWVPKSKRWRWKGRKNTSRNKLISILSFMLAGMLYPYVYAKNEQDQENKMTARVMRILVEDALRKADYEMKFLYMILSALVNPAVFVEVEYIEAIQRIKQRLTNGTIRVVEAIDELLSGLNLNTIPIDEIILCDFYSGTGNVQRLPVLMRLRRIPWDEARAKWSNKYYTKGGKDIFGFVQAGKTRVVLSGADEKLTLFNVDWTEADRDYVQELTPYYRSEDLQFSIVGGVFMGNEEDPYNSNPFEHRRLTLVKEEWMSVPIIPIVMSGYEPIDPAGRFAYFKSGSFKLFWDDASQNAMHRILHDGTYLDVIKPVFLSGVSKVDSTTMAPGATFGMPMGAQMTAYSLSPNLAAAMQLMQEEKKDEGDSTVTEMMQGSTPNPGVTAYATQLSEQNARLKMGVFGIMVASMLKGVGELTVDCVIQNNTIGELDNTVPDSLRMKYMTTLTKSKDKGKEVTNRIVFSDQYMGRNLTKAQKEKAEWGIYNASGDTPEERHNADTRTYIVNPYEFARYTYTMYVDVDDIIQKSAGTDQQRNITAFNMLTDPRVAPFTNQKNVVDDFVIDEFGGDDPERYKKQGELLNSVMSPNLPPNQTGGPQPPQGSPVVSPMQSQPQQQKTY